MIRVSSVFFFNDTATTEIYTLSLHDARPIFGPYGEPSEDTNEWFVRSGAATPSQDGWTSNGMPRSRSQSTKDRKSTRLNSSHANISYAVFCLKNNKSTYLATPNANHYHHIIK